MGNKVSRCGLIQIKELNINIKIVDFNKYNFIFNYKIRRKKEKK